MSESNPPPIPPRAPSGGMPMMARVGASSMPPSGLLAPTAGNIPPLPPVPGLTPAGMRPAGMRLGSEQVLAYLLKQPESTSDDSDQDLPPGLRNYAAGLRPTPRPAGAGWQQEIIYERLGKTDNEIEGVAQYYYRIAQNYDMYLSRERITASQYYAGRPLGDELSGRSQLVMTVVRDTIRSMLPSLLRIFTAVEDPVSFEPVSAEIYGDDRLSTQLARQATDYCRWALFNANAGWQVLHDVLLDALTRKAGWVRWYWGARNQVRTEVCEGLLLPQLQMLLAEPGISTQRIVRRPMDTNEVKALSKTPDGQMYLSQGGSQEFWSATITRSAQQAWPVVEAVPSECVWVVADANTVADARAIWHVRDVTASSLVEMGLPEDKVMEHHDALMRPQLRREQIARDNATGYNIRPAPPNDRSMGYVRYAEGWVRCDADNDNRAELLHVHMLGNATTLIQWERVDEIPLACFTPYREPSRLIGSSVADMVMDLQRIESRVMRAVLDSLGQSMFPRTVAVLGQANLADVRQTAIGSIIRVAQPGAVTELVKPYAGKEALPVMEVLEAIRESRTGITRASQGLTVDELQSTTPLAVSQQSTAAQDRLDMVARTLAETGLAPLYAGLLRMMARQQDRPNVIRIRGQWISIDPRALATMWETSVNVGGRGSQTERMAMLAQLAGKQEMILQTQGLQNPLVGVQEYRNTLARMLETVNISDVSSYFKQLPPGWQPPPQQQAPDPNQILAQVESQKTAANVENDRAEQQTKRANILMGDDLERDKAALDAWTRVYVAASTAGTPLPAISEFKQAMASRAPAIGLLSDLPGPSSAQPPAVGSPPPSAKPPGVPGGGAPPLGGGRPPGGQQPLMPPNAPMAAPGNIQPQMDPATTMAVRQALQGRGIPGAYGTIANRAVASALAGPAGPQLPPSAKPMPQPGPPAPG